MITNNELDNLILDCDWTRCFWKPWIKEDLIKFLEEENESVENLDSALEFINQNSIKGFIQADLSLFKDDLINFFEKYPNIPPIETTLQIIINYYNNVSNN